jgi:hypothetical protein
MLEELFLVLVRVKARARPFRSIGREQQPAARRTHVKCAVPEIGASQIGKGPLDIGQPSPLQVGSAEIGFGET